MLYGNSSFLSTFGVHHTLIKPSRSNEVCTFYDISEHVLYETLSQVIDLTSSDGWRFSLRLVNRQFNEALLHVYLQKRLVPNRWHHSVDCTESADNRISCVNQLCQANQDRRKKDSYIARFSLRSLLATRAALPEDSPHGRQPLCRWEAALAILQREKGSLNLSDDQLQFYSTCSVSPAFNHVYSAILAEALHSYVGSDIPRMLAHCDLIPRYRLEYHLQTAEFWVALSACVVGSLQLCEMYLDPLTLSHQEASAVGRPNSLIAHQLPTLLAVAAEHGRLDIIHLLLEKRPNLMSEESTNHDILRRAVFAGSNQVLKIILEYTPNNADTLVKALEFGKWRTNSWYTWPVKFLDKSRDSSEKIRLLASHFTPLSPPARGELTLQACAVGDVPLLKELCGSEPLFSHPRDFPPGRRPSYVHFAVRSGNLDTLRFLLDHGVVRDNRLKLAIEKPSQAMSFDQIECYRELRHHFNKLCCPNSFFFLAMANGAEDLMASYLAEHRDQIVGIPWGESWGSGPKMSMAQLALECAIQRLRPGNVRYLLNLGVRLCAHPKGDDWKACMYTWWLPGVKDAFTIPWPYFNMNRTAFQRTQRVLDSFVLPKLRVVA